METVIEAMVDKSDVLLTQAFLNLWVNEKTVFKIFRPLLNCSNR